MVEITIEFYFGLRKNDGTEVTPEEFDDFVATVIIPSFPEGGTIYESNKGYYNTPDGTLVTEPTIVVENIVKVTFPYPATIQKVITEYKNRFLQDYLPLVKISYTFSNLFSTV